MKKVVDLCNKYNVYLDSDEIHGDLALFGHPYISALEFRKSTTSCLFTPRREKPSDWRE